MLKSSQRFTAVRTYCQWRDELGRRETWEEAVARYIGFMRKRFDKVMTDAQWSRAEYLMQNTEAFGSMRALQMAGPALERDSTTGYNCCCVVFDDLKKVSDTLYILMAGTGVGFSTESQFIRKMPTVALWKGESEHHIVEDSAEGWAEAFRIGLEGWFAGRNVDFDYSRIRPAGARLKTKGGRASGPEPLKKLFDFTREITRRAQTRQLTSIEWLDIGNMIGEIVVSGGVRRSSMINFSDLDDDSIRYAKQWPFPQYRAMSNNSAVYLEKPSEAQFKYEWKSLRDSGTGERGIFSEYSFLKHMPARRSRQGKLRTNPCGEIGLKADKGQFCNLSTVILRPSDDIDSFKEKAFYAAKFGAMQSALTDFKYISRQMKEITDEERLLGVSISGQFDALHLMEPVILRDIHDFVIDVAHSTQKQLEIPLSAAVTCGKPDGTCSLVADCSSGAHPRYAKKYLRRIRISATDPLYKLMRDSGQEFWPENGQTEETATTFVCQFAEQAPDGVPTRDDLSAIDHLKHYLMIQKNWSEHNQSITVQVRPEEWGPVGDFVYANFDDICGVSFLPFDSGRYALAPYQVVSDEEWEKAKRAEPPVDYSLLSEYEQSDDVEQQKLAACSGGSCSI